MYKPLAVEKTVILRTRDFIAESYAKDGTAFQITRRGDGEDALSHWWLDHRFDNHRHTFRDIDDEDALHLACHDVTEAMALVEALQHEYNGVAL